jgi:predicted small secreted protein
MKKTLYMFMAAGLLTFASCTTTEKAAEDVEDTAEEAADEVEDAVDR